MSEEKFLSIEETFTKKLKHAWDNGFENGKSSALPWRKPEERPEVDEDLLLCINWKRCMGYYSGLGTWRVFGGGYFEDDKIQGWCYADELPLPDWVQK